MKQPMIGVIPLYDSEKNSVWMIPGYLNGLRHAGGLPVMLPLEATSGELEQLDSHLDGYLFPGGHDVDPAYYGAKQSANCGETCPYRDTLEKHVYGLAWKADKPVLGICRGLQLLNVLHGGTLYQDLPTEFDTAKEIDHHMTPPYERAVHEVELTANSPLYELLRKEKLAVNSYHHQGICRLGEGLSVMARAEDGLAEAVCAPEKKWIWAVQWHPEWMYSWDEDQEKIFTAFVKACQQ
ncbi:MAG: gamma-glutamyl-gamma-aminobutyrate hydrolase family protein [Ruminococcus sp.]